MDTKVLLSPCDIIYFTEKKTRTIPTYLVFIGALKYEIRAGRVTWTTIITAKHFIIPPFLWQNDICSCLHLDYLTNGFPQPLKILHSQGKYSELEFSRKFSMHYRNLVVTSLSLAVSLLSSPRLWPPYALTRPSLCGYTQVCGHDPMPSYPPKAKSVEDERIYLLVHLPGALAYLPWLARFLPASNYKPLMFDFCIRDQTSRSLLQVCFRSY